MRQCRTSWAACGVAFLLCAPVERALAIDKTWTGGVGNWSEPAKWSPPGVPAPGDHAIIPATSFPALTNVTLNVDATVARLTLGSSGGMGAQAGLSSNGHVLTLTGVVSSFVDAQGMVVLTNATINVTGSATLMNSGQIICEKGTSTLLGPFQNSDSGTLRVQGSTSPAVLNVPGGFTNFGWVELTYCCSGSVNQATLSGGTLVNSGTLWTSTLGPRPFVRNFNMELENHGEVELEADCTFGKVGVVHTNEVDGVINILGDAELTIQRPGIGTPGFVNDGAVNCLSGGTFNLGAGAPSRFFTNNGTITLGQFADADIDGGVTSNGGTISLSTGASLKQVGGTFELLDAGALNQSNAETSFANCDLTLHSDLFVDNGTTLSVTNGQVDGDAILQNAGGVLNLAAATLNVPVENFSGGLVKITQGSGRSETSANSGFTNTFATLRIQAATLPARLVILDDFTNNGTVELTSIGDEVATLATGNLYNNNIINAQAGLGGLRVIEANLINNAQLNFQTDSLVDLGQLGEFMNAGGIVVSGGSNATIRSVSFGATQLTNSGDIVVLGGNTLAVINDGLPQASLVVNTGSLRGHGTIMAGAIQNAGEFKPGGIIGMLPSGYTLSTPLFQQSFAGELHTRIAGPTPNASYDQISVTGQAQLDGSLFVSLSPVSYGGGKGAGPIYNPQVGQTFDLLTCTQLNGAFRLAHLPGFADERYMLVSYNSGVELAGAPSVSVSVYQLESLTDFSDSKTVPLPGVPTDGVLGDLDNNGTLDLAITIPAEGNQPGHVLILFNGGSIGDEWQGFTSSLQVPVGVFPIAVTTGLFNNDQILDLAVANRLDGIVNGTVTVLMNNGGSPGSSFTPLAPITVGVHPSSIASANFDNSAAGAASGDDIVVTNRDSNSVSILVKTSPTTYAVTEVPAGRVPIEVDPADVDLDRGVGFTDLVVLNQGSADVWVYPNSGGVFGPPVAYPVGANPTALKVGVLNNDALVDIAVTNEDDNDVSILINDGGGTYASAVTVAAPNQPRSIALADLDQDANGDTGFADLDLAVLVTSAGDSAVQILRNDTDGETPGAPLALTTGDLLTVDNGAILVLAGDLDNLDNGDDLVTVNDSGSPLAGAQPGLTVVLNGASPPCPADIAGDNDTVNVDDLLTIINSWGTCNLPGPETCPADINDTGVVNVDDLLEVINNWGDCPVK